MSKKFSLLLAVLMVATFILAACQPAATPTPEEVMEPTEADCAKPEVLCVGLVTDVGEVDDKSFNQSAWDGVLAAQELNLARLTKYVETKDAKDYGANIALFADAQLRCDRDSWLCPR
jgi:basic membrane protein A and related proteins